MDIPQLWQTVVWAGLVAGLFGWATLQSQKLMYRDAAKDLGDAIHLYDGHASWATRFLNMFDALFGDRDFSSKRLGYSVIASTIGVVLLWLLFGPILGVMNSRADLALPLGAALVQGLVINFAADFVSLAETRWVLRQFERVKSAWGQMLLLLADVLATAAVIWVAIALFRLAQGERVLSPVELIVGYSAYAIFFYSTFITSIWAWAYAAAVLVVRFLSSRFVERISKFEKPFEWLAAVVTIAVFAIVMAVEITRQVIPEDFDTRLCGVTGGVVCTHAARLSPDQTAALELLKRACTTGDAAQCRVAFDSLGTKQGPEALRLLELACIETDDMDACNLTGIRYYNGYGTPKDLELGHVFFDRACDGGDLSGCTNLASGYYLGEGVAQDFIQASKLYRRVCSAGGMQACANLGRLYHEGAGVPQSYSNAHGFFTQACDRGNMSGCVNLGALYLMGQGVEKDYSRAGKLFRTACYKGNMYGCNLVGHLYRGGIGEIQDYDRARKLFTTACDGGDETACENLRNLPL